jgi:hypothetical protein
MFFSENQGVWKLYRAQIRPWSVVISMRNTVVMEMVSAKAEIRHVFGFTFFCRAGPPVI